MVLDPFKVHLNGHCWSTVCSTSKLAPCEYPKEATEESLDLWAPESTFQTGKKLPALNRPNSGVAVAGIVKHGPNIRKAVFHNPTGAKTSTVVWVF